MSVHIQLRDFKFQYVSLTDFQIGPSLEAVQDFLDSAILAAWYEASPVSMPPTLTPARWVWRLAGSYHTTHNTTAFLRQAAERFIASGRWDLAQWASERASEEQGHDQLALLDIQAMGYDPNLVVNHLVPSAAVELVNYFSQHVEAIDPIGCVGYMYVLERLATRIGASAIQRVKAILPPDVKATRCLWVHSSLGADADHVKENIAAIAQLTLAEQCNVAIACYETAKMCFTPPQGGYISEQALKQRLDSLHEAADLACKCLPSETKATDGATNCQQEGTAFQNSFFRSAEKLDFLLKSQLQAGLPNGQDDQV